MNDVFITLTRAVEGSAPVAIAAAALWGMLSILLSPCHLAAIPLIIGFVDEQGKISTKRAFILSSLFSVGILITIALLGIITALLGRMMGDVGQWGNGIVAVVFFLVGLHLLEVISLPFSGFNKIGIKSKGLLAALVLGLVFGIALGPCTFAYMAPILAVSFGIAGTDPLYGIALIFAYGMGHCGVIVLAGTSLERVQHFLNWNEKSNGTVYVKKLCGILVLLAGLYLVYLSV